MKLYERLKRLEAKAPAEQPIFVVKFGAKLTYLQYGGDKYFRLENEPESDFIKRARLLAENNPKPNIVLVGNIC